VQGAFSRRGLQIRRLESGVSTTSAAGEARRLAGSDVHTIVEFGAADGRDSEAYAKEYPKARVVAVEPLPASFKKLCDRAALHKNLVAVEAAIGEVSGEATFFVASEGDASSLSKPNDTGSAFDLHAETVAEIQVHVVTLAELCRQHEISSIDLLKMDAQGAELKAMRGADSLLRSGAIRVIYSEVQFVRLYEEACLFHELSDFLYGFGYKLHGLYDFNHNEHGQLCWGDAIWIRNT
jgi:FkbM family methyltransferase